MKQIFSSIPPLFRQDNAFYHFLGQHTLSNLKKTRFSFYMIITRLFMFTVESIALQGKQSYSEQLNEIHV